MDFTGGLGDLLGAGLNFYLQKQQKDQTNKEALNAFKLQQLQLKAQVAASNAAAAQAQAQSQAGQPKTGMPSWVKPVAIAGGAVLVVGLVLVMTRKAA